MRFVYDYSHKNQRLTLSVEDGDRGTELSFEALDDIIEEFSDVRVIAFEHKGINQEELFKYVNYIYKVYPDIRVIF